MTAELQQVIPSNISKKLRHIGRSIQLLPLNVEEDWQELFPLAQDMETWKYTVFGPFENEGKFRDFLFDLEQNRIAYTVVTVPRLVNTGHQGDYKSCRYRKIGNITFLNNNQKNRTIEIGSIWYGKEYRGGAVNFECCFLLLEYAFETLQYRRVEWKCDSRNIASNKAAIKLGFTFEGTFRNHMIVRGNNRDSNYYSIIDSEWQDRRKKILQLMDSKLSLVQSIINKTSSPGDEDGNLKTVTAKL